MSKWKNECIECGKPVFDQVLDKVGDLCDGCFIGNAEIVSGVQLNEITATKEDIKKYYEEVRENLLEKR